MSPLLESILIGIITGLFSGWLSSYLVTKYYRRKDDMRDKDDYMLNLKRHIVSIYRILKIIQFNPDYERKIEYTENLKNELLYAPKYQNRFKLSDDEMKILAEYEKNLKNIKDELSEYGRCKNVIYILEKRPGKTDDDKKALHKTRGEQKVALDRLGRYNGLWMLAISKFEI